MNKTCRYCNNGMKPLPPESLPRWKCTKCGHLE